ncbi:MAG: SIR2 family NAD-dependent protein deacylase [Desulfobulbales bacterium]
MAENDFDKAIALLQRCRNGVALTGAGVSTESHIPDFRGKNGLWSRFDPYEYGTLGAFRSDPVKVWRMLALLLEIVDAEPNLGHEALAALEQRGVLTGIITQNIDGLHRKGGSRNVIEFHGSLATFSCLSCGASYECAFVKQLSLPPHCPVCDSVLKPDIVFFDERISDIVMARTEQMLTTADLLRFIGTSCQVQPAASIPLMVYRRGGAIIEINREPTLRDIATVTLEGNFTAVMEKLIEGLA